MELLLFLMFFGGGSVIGGLIGGIVLMWLHDRRVRRDKELSRELWKSVEIEA